MCNSIHNIMSRRETKSECKYMGNCSDWEAGGRRERREHQLSSFLFSHLTQKLHYLLHFCVVHFIQLVILGRCELYSNFHQRQVPYRLRIRSLKQLHAISTVDLFQNIESSCTLFCCTFICPFLNYSCPQYNSPNSSSHFNQSISHYAFFFVRNLQPISVFQIRCLNANGTCSSKRPEAMGLTLLILFGNTFSLNCLPAVMVFFFL